MKREQRKEMILESAKKLFSKNGYYQTQISDIVAEARIARGTIYQYFDNKQDLFLTLLEDYTSLWEKAIALEEAMDLSRIDPVDYFRHRIRKTLEFFAKDQDLCNITLRMALGLPGDLEDIVRRFEKRITRLIVGDLTLGVKNRNVRPDLDVELTANLLAGALMRTAYYYFGRDLSDTPAVDLDEATEKITAVFAPGIFV